MSADSRTTTGDGCHPATNLQSHHKTPDFPIHEHRWSVHVSCNKHELFGSYSVVLLLGHVPEDPRKWEVCPSYVGVHSIYTSRPNSDQQFEHQRNNPIIVKGAIPLNHVLVRHPELESLEPDVVVPYLTKNLHWRIATVKTLSIIVQPWSVLILFPGP